MDLRMMRERERYFFYENYAMIFLLWPVAWCVYIEFVLVYFFSLFHASFRVGSNGNISEIDCGVPLNPERMKKKNGDKH